jgi:hypothetical protein
MLHTENMAQLQKLACVDESCHAGLTHGRHAGLAVRAATRALPLEHMLITGVLGVPSFLL